MEKFKINAVLKVMNIKDVSADELLNFIQEYRLKGKIITNIDKADMLTEKLNKTFIFNHSRDEWIRALDNIIKRG